MRIDANSRVGLPRWVWAFALLLAGASVLLVFSREDDTIFPSLTSNRASGVAAYGRMLSQVGYDVRANRDPAPRLRLDEVAVAFMTQSQDNDEAFQTALDNHVRRGGRALIVFVRGELKSSPTLTEIARVAGRAETLDTSYDFNDVALPDTTRASIALWTRTHDSTQVARLVAQGDGARLEVAAMDPFSNRLLDIGDNAAFALDVLGTIAGDRRRVVFLEAAFGNAHSFGLAQAIGPWFAALTTQLVVLFLVIVYSLGKTFGRVRVQARPEAGTRELLDGMAELMRRGRKADAAWRMVAGYGMTLARRRTRLGSDATDTAVLERLPDEWRLPLERREARDLRPEEAASLARALTEAIDRSGRL